MKVIRRIYGVIPELFGREMAEIGLVIEQGSPVNGEPKAKRTRSRLCQ